MPSQPKINRLSITQRAFGTLSNGESAALFTLSNTHGVRVKISNYGGIIVALETLDKNAVSSDIVLGYDDIKAYENDPYYLGAIIGRYAGRIDQGLLSIDDKTYQLDINNNDNQLHGGHKALNKKLWQATTESSAEKVSLILQHTSPDGDNGFPGNVEFTVKYSLNCRNELAVEYFANTDKTTVINLTQHSYFNLAGHNSGDIYQHQIQINADYFLPMNEDIYPTGEIRAVLNSAHDFSQLSALGKNINSNDEQVIIAKGYDNYWLSNDNVISGEIFSARAFEPNSGRQLTMYSAQPCLILYTANYIDGSQTGKEHCVYQQHSAFCFEPQNLATRINGANINNTIVRPEQPFYSQTRFVFETV
ncbi:aldose epimerase family protein [Colwellia sp. MB02u-9]|uniref:aldose epimerase family protein n=1 Tax=Colwellia sp. MB02u-9 TaxID=2759823 RepID=UPI0015F60492|nr:aldose epimerase family protein [Colwellia sp. MB02u-9]MBA6296986.1 galactose mutarotase [Colwellia sp. MB02u-9]